MERDVFGRKEDSDYRYWGSHVSAGIEYTRYIFDELFLF